MAFSVLVCVCCALLAIVLWAIERRARFRSLDNFPGPDGIPVLGNALQMGTNPADFLAALVKFTQQYGSHVKLWICNRPFLFISEEKMVEFFLTSTTHLVKTKDYQFLKAWLGKGLLIANGGHWKEHRKIITPAFHFKLLENAVEVFHSAGEDLLENLRKCVGEKQTDLHHLITRYTLDVICETAMGITLKAQEDEKSNEYVEAIKDECYILIRRAFSAWMQFDLLFPLSKEYQMEQKATKILHEFSRKVISKRRAALLEKKTENFEDETGVKKRMAFLDLLLETTVDGKPLDAEMIREEVDTFMFAGHDTSSSALGFTLYELSNNPDVQNKLYEEIKHVMGPSRRNLSLTDLNDMKYLEMVIKEGLRKYPPVPFYARELQEDVYYNGILLPKGLNIEIFTFGLHRNPDIYPDPEKFDPDRFLPENVSQRSPYAFVPFSAGPRNCIGQKFAMLEMKMALAQILYEFEFSTAGPEFAVMLSGEAVLKPLNGFNVCIKNRN